MLRRARRGSERRPYTEGAAAAARGRIRAAVSFLRWLDDHRLDLQTLSQADLDHWLTSGSTHRYEIRAFLRWPESRSLTQKLTVPQRSFKQPPSNLPSDEERSRQLQRCLTDMALPPEVRAAGALVVLFGLPDSKIVQLTVEQLVEHDEVSYLTIDRQAVLIPPRLAEVLRLAAMAPARSALGRSLPGTQWLFPGISPGRHRGAGALSRRLLEHGIEVRCARNIALLTLAAELPAPLLADLLGMHITTASRWVDYARRDWSSYLAARAEDRRVHASVN